MLDVELSLESLPNEEQVVRNEKTKEIQLFKLPLIVNKKPEVQSYIPVEIKKELSPKVVEEDVKEEQEPNTYGSVAFSKKSDSAIQTRIQFNFSRNA